MRTVSDSDVSTVDYYSPYQYPNVAPDYYVQSPSVDYYDGNLPSDSPSHNSISRCSSVTRDRRMLNELGWFDYGTIEEDVNYGDYDGGDNEICSVVFKLLAGLACFALICIAAGFSLWGVSRQYSPQVAVESLIVDYFHAGIGQDLTGVPTKMIGVNCTVMINLFNPAPYFGLHVTSTHLSLSYAQITVAVNQLEEYYLPKKSHQAKSIILNGDQIPLYGASPYLDLQSTSITAPMTLQLDIITQGNVLGFLVRVKAYKQITCNLVIVANSNSPIMFSDDDCSSN